MTVFPAGRIIIFAAGPMSSMDPSYRLLAVKRAAVFEESSNSMTLNFREELPLLIASTFIIVVTP
jgi:hypothetical protein